MSYIQVLVNGVAVEVGNASTSADCYFSCDEGVTAREWSKIIPGDTFHWNETYAGYALDASDIVEKFYGSPLR